MATKYKNLLKPHLVPFNPNGQIFVPRAIAARSFNQSEVLKLYNVPAPLPNAKRQTCVVVSFGGGLIGNFDPKTKLMTSGDCITEWKRSIPASTPHFPTVKILTVGGAQNVPNAQDGGPTGENTLDVEFLGTTAPNVDIILVIAPNTMQGFQLAFATARDMNPKPFGISCSWGLGEQQVPRSIVVSINSVLQQLTEAGVNITCSSGDNGSSDGNAANTNETDFPGCSPFVVCCGGTSLRSVTNAYDAKTTEETVWNTNARSAATGGGKSTLFVQPPFQKSTLPNETMRCTPDISMVADSGTGVKFTVGGRDVVYGGTSIVSPLVMGILVVCECKGVLANNLIYRIPRDCFHDITQGNNGFFKAGPGFDFCSGLGSPDVARFKQALQILMSGGTLPSPPTLPPTPAPTPPTPTPPTQSITPTLLQFIGTRQPQQLILLLTQSRASSTTTWTSTDTRVATVSSQGLVTPVADGQCLIRCSAVAQTVPVTVSGLSSTIPVTALAIGPAVAVGSNFVLMMTSFLPSNASSPRNITWASSNPTIASVETTTGRVRGLQVGQVRITATVQDALATQAVCVVQVV
jgi:subtilase family serine protease